MPPSDGPGSDGPGSRGPGSRGPAPSADPRLAVVVITHNRVDELVRTLDRLSQLPERPPVIVVDNASSDGTAGTVSARFPEVVLLQPGRNLGAVGRNLGVATARAPYVAFCDDDTWWEAGSLARAAELFDAHPDLAVITGHIVVEPGGRDDPVCAEMADSPLPIPAGLPGRPILSFLAGASVVRRRAFLQAGGFEPHLFLGGEEELLAADLASAGWAMAYVAECRVHHHPSVARDPHLRRCQGIRNTLWTTWLRRPLPSALRRSARLVRSLPRDAVSGRALVQAAAGLPWVMRHRRVVPPSVEAGLRLLDEPQLTSTARRYVS